MCLQQRDLLEITKQEQLKNDSKGKTVFFFLQLRILIVQEADL